MKERLLAGAAAALLSLTALTPTAAAARMVPVTVNGSLLPSASYLSGGVTAVSLRALLETAGWTVTWDSQAGQAAARCGDASLTARPGETVLTVNGQDRATTAPVFLRNGRTYVPVRSLCQALGWEVCWDGSLGGAAVTTGVQVNGAAAEGPAWTEEDLYWLSRVISAESRGESFQGQLAVGSVVMNRVASDEFPDTIREVVFDCKDGVQFEPVSNGTIYDEPSPLSVTAAKQILSGGESVVGDCLYFYAPALSQGKWINANRTYYTTIGCHRFYL